MLGMGMRKVGWRGALLCGLMVAVTPLARADSNHCDNPPKESHYLPQAGDREEPTQLSLSRAFSGSGHLELNVCYGEVRIRPSQDGQLHLKVEASEAPELKMRGYVKTLEVAGDRATISLEFPKRLHPHVLLEVPASGALTSEINLGSGDLLFYATGQQGRRELNLGSGGATIYLNGDQDYSQLEANVGMGSFHDHRPGGQSAHMVISKDLSGKGASPLEVNVGAGSVDLKAAE